MNSVRELNKVADELEETTKGTPLRFAISYKFPADIDIDSLDEKIENFLEGKPFNKWITSTLYGMHDMPNSIHFFIYSETPSDVDIGQKLDPFMKTLGGERFTYLKKPTIHPWKKKKVEKASSWKKESSPLFEELKMNPAKELRKIALELENKREAESKVKIEKLDDSTLVISGLPEKAVALAKKVIELDQAGEDAGAADMEREEEWDKIQIQLEEEGNIDPAFTEGGFADPVYTVSAVRGNRVIKTRHREKHET